MMESKGYPRYGGPTGVMFHEHEQGRSFIRAMSEAIDAAAQGDAVALAKFGTNATELCQYAERAYPQGGSLPVYNGE